MLIYQRVNEPQTLQSSPLLARPERAPFGSLGHVRSLRVGSLIQGAGRHSCPPFGYPSPLRCHPKEPQPPPPKKMSKDVGHLEVPGNTVQHHFLRVRKNDLQSWWVKSTSMQTFTGKIHIYVESMLVCRVKTHSFKKIQNKTSAASPSALLQHRSPTWQPHAPSSKDSKGLSCRCQSYPAEIGCSGGY